MMYGIDMSWIKIKDSNNKPKKAEAKIELQLILSKCNLIATCTNIHFYAVDMTTLA